jgi:hypothetical protein
MQRYKILHRTYYNFNGTLRLGPHHLRPRKDNELRIEYSALTITPPATPALAPGRGGKLSGYLHAPPSTDSLGQPTHVWAEVCQPALVGKGSILPLEKSSERII